MRKLIIPLFAAGLLVTGMVALKSCNKDFLNTEPLDKISSDATWSDGALSQAFIYNVYSYLGYVGLRSRHLRRLQMKPCSPRGQEYQLRLQKGRKPSNLAWRVTITGDRMYLAIVRLYCH
jgi:hypothetical protein